jgi:hypothetical protein
MRVKKSNYHERNRYAKAKRSISKIKLNCSFSEVGPHKGTIGTSDRGDYETRTRNPEKCGNQTTF